MTSGAVKPLFWLVLALPAVWFAWRLGHGELALKLEEPSGETAVRLLIIALLPGPLAEVFGRHTLLRLWLQLRRNIGVAAFLYAVLHLLLYALDVQTVAALRDELSLPGIWTGWLALALMVPPAATSFDRAMRALRRRWQHVQYLLYAAVVVAAAHWLLLDWSWKPVAVHLAPLIIAWSMRAWHRSRAQDLRRSVI